MPRTPDHPDQAIGIGPIDEPGGPGGPGKRAMYSLGPKTDLFLLLLQAHGLPLPVREYLFAPPRRWRADYCWPIGQVIVERDGGIFRGGRQPGTRIGGHSSVTGILRDMAKANAAQLAGFLYLRFTVRQLTSGEALPLIQRALQRHDKGGRP